MAIILRVDVDKPYGKHNILRRILSKFKEDYYPDLNIRVGYLSHLKRFLHYCNSNSVRGTFYHRICTAPDQEVLDLQREGGHEVGMHLENSRSKETFLAELHKLQSLITTTPIRSFSKHGSGYYKLGKYHYAKYEPQRYLEWAKEFNYSFPSGNEIAKKMEDLCAENGFFKSIFWLEPDYRHPDFCTVSDLIKAALHFDVVVLIHPTNYVFDKTTREEFHLLVKLAMENNIPWKLFPT